MQSMVAIYALGEKLSCRQVFLERAIFDICKNDDLKPPETLKIMFLKRFRCADAHCGSPVTRRASCRSLDSKSNTHAADLAEALGS